MMKVEFENNFGIDLEKNEWEVERINDSIKTFSLTNDKGIKVAFYEETSHSCSFHYKTKDWNIGITEDPYLSITVTQHNSDELSYTVKFNDANITEALKFVKLNTKIDLESMFLGKPKGLQF